MNKTNVRYGRVMILAGWVQDGRRLKNVPRYESVLVRQDEDGSLSYYLGGPTCNTSDGYVSLPEQYHDAVVWDK